MIISLGHRAKLSFISTRHTCSFPLYTTLYSSLSLQSITVCVFYSSVYETLCFAAFSMAIDYNVSWADTPGWVTQAASLQKSAKGEGEITGASWENSPALPLCYLNTLFDSIYDQCHHLDLYLSPFGCMIVILFLQLEARTDSDSTYLSSGRHNLFLFEWAEVFL